MKNSRYRISKPCKDALERLRKLRLGARLASKNGTPSEVRDLSFQAAIFQASATMEEYIKQIFDLCIFEIKTHKSDCHSLPSRSRYSYFLREMAVHFANYVAAGDEIAMVKKIEKKVDLFNFALGEISPPSFLNGSMIYKDRKYPSPDNIRALYSRIGCDNIFDQMSREIKSDSEMMLKGFNDIRTALAHSSPPQLTINDVCRNLDVAETIIAAMDKITAKTLASTFGGPVW